MALGVYRHESEMNLTTYEAVLSNFHDFSQFYKASDASSVPGQGAKIPPAAQHSQKERKKE